LISIFLILKIAGELKSEPDFENFQDSADQAFMYLPEKNAGP